MITATEELCALFVKAALDAEGTADRGVMAGLDAVLWELQSTIQSMQLSLADKQFIARMGEKGLTAEQEADLVFRSCTALIISKLSGEVAQEVPQ